jgi:molybdopterin converting factor small subunit
VRVQVSLFGDVNRHLHGREKEHAQDLPDGATVSDLLAALGIDLANEVQLTIGVNGELGRPDSRLSDGDKVMLVTPMEGG